MQQLINYINQYAKLNEEAIVTMQKLAETETFKKNEIILDLGQRCSKIWYLQSGMVRKFHLHDDNEITSWIHTENEFFTSLLSYARQIPSTEYLKACEDTIAIGLSRENSKKLARFPQFVTFSNAIMEEQFVNMDVHTKAFNQKDAQQKYEYLKTIAPEMVKRAKLKHIASIMGVTLETLSRIRALK